MIALSARNSSSFKGLEIFWGLLDPAYILLDHASEMKEKLLKLLNYLGPEPCVSQCHEITYQKPAKQLEKFADFARNLPKNCISMRSTKKVVPKQVLLMSMSRQITTLYFGPDRNDNSPYVLHSSTLT